MQILNIAQGFKRGGEKDDKEFDLDLGGTHSQDDFIQNGQILSVIDPVLHEQKNLGLWKVFQVNLPNLNGVDTLYIINQ